MTAHAPGWNRAENCVGGYRRWAWILVDKLGLEIPLKNKCWAYPLISLHLNPRGVSPWVNSDFCNDMFSLNLTEMITKVERSLAIASSVGMWRAFDTLSDTPDRGRERMRRTGREERKKEMWGEDLTKCIRDTKDRIDSRVHLRILTLNLAIFILNEIVIEIC